MKLVLRKPSELAHNYEFLFGILFLPLFAAASLLIVSLAPHIPMLCVFHRLTGFPCPACGSCRCVHELLAGHFLEAWLTQPLITVLVVMAAAFAAYSWIVVLFKLPRLRLEGVSRLQRRLMAWLAVAAVLANWVYLAVRGL